MKCLKNQKKKVVTGLSTVAGLITITLFVGNTPQEIQINSEAVQKVEEVILSECFEKEWLEANIDLDQTNGMSKKEVLDFVRASKVTVELEAYRKGNSVIGYTYASSDRVWFNRKFHDGFSLCDKGSNFAHELLGHKNGFSHDSKATKRRPLSVPYQLGTVFDKCCKE